MTGKQRREYSKEFERINRRYEVKYFPKVKSAIKSKISSLIDVVKARGINEAITYLSSDITNTRVSDVVLKMYLEVGLRHARWQERLLMAEGKRYIPDMESKGFGFNDVWTNFIKNYLNSFLLEKLTYNVNNTTRAALLSVLNNAVSEGWGIDQTVRELDDLPFTETQAARIVRTEINRAANVGNLAQGDSYPYETLKEWIAAKDNRTRGNPINGQQDHANHWALDGVVVDFYDTFTDPRNGDQLQAPGDPKASASSTVNCRCTIAKQAKKDSNGGFIPKKSRVSVIREVMKPVIIKYFATYNGNGVEIKGYSFDDAENFCNEYGLKLIGEINEIIEYD